ncbi:MAG: serine hydrolase domain-containing protein [Pseudomonadales bacterium]
MIKQDFFSTPEQEGADPEAVQKLLLRVQQEVDEGLLPSAQIALAKNGKVIAFETYGDATNDSLYCIFSATKAITSAAAWLLIQEGKLDVSKKVVDYVPEFGDNDKQDIIVEQLFTHTAGFPSAPFRPLLWNDKEATLKRFGDWRLNWQPGSRYEYHPTSSMWVIAEIIERLSGSSYQSFVRERIALPLGLDEMWVGIPESYDERIALISHCGDAMTPDDYKKLGLPVPPETEVNEEVLGTFNTREIRAVGVPGGGGIMSAAELAMFYQSLIHGGNAPDGSNIWKPETLEFALQVRTEGFKDPLTQVPVSRGLGLVIAGDEQRNHRGFGHTNSASAFGHGGAGGQIAWGDPETGISVGYCTNGHDRNTVREARRCISISTKAAACAG